MQGQDRIRSQESQGDVVSPQLEPQPVAVTDRFTSQVPVTDRPRTDDRVNLTLLSVTSFPAFVLAKAQKYKHETALVRVT